MELYNEEETYDNEISPLLKQIIKICNEHHIPMFATFAFENDEEKGGGHCTTILNGFEGRHCESIKEANAIVRQRGPSTFTMTIASQVDS